MKINHRIISTDMPPLVIAEIGINHSGSLSLAKEMVDLASKSGCEIIKHQTHFVDDEMTPEAKVIFPPNSNKNIWDIMASCSLSETEECDLKEYVESLGMIYISTPFSRRAADFLNELDVPAFKIGSGECNHIPLIKHICSFGKPIIMSTGLHNIETIKKSVQVIDSYGIPYALLECTNLYPSPPEIVSLKGIAELRDNFPKAVIGFSDHSIGPAMALGAVALGASIIERHFTDTRYREGPDISCSMDSAELRYLINTSKEIWIATKNSKMRSAAEEQVFKFARGSVVADRDLQVGHVITERDIWARRPGNGEISVDEFELVLGKTVVNQLKRNQQISWSDLV